MKNEEVLSFRVLFVGKASETGVSEGLNVLLTDLVKNLVGIGLNVTIYTTKRHLRGLVRILNANGLDESQVTIEALTNGSRLLKLFSGDGKKEKKKKFGEFFLRKLRDGFSVKLMARIASWVVDGHPVAVIFKLLAALFVFSVFGVGALALSPILVLLGLTFFAFKKAKNFLAKVYGRLAGKLGLPRSVRLFLTSKASLISDELYSLESQRFATAVRKLKHNDPLFIHTAFEGTLVKELYGHKRTLVVFPDAVAYVFRTRYLPSLNQSALDSIKYASALVCYSKYVYKQQLEKYFSKALGGKAVHVIPQGFFEKSDNVVLSQTLEGLNSYVKGLVCPRESLGEVQFGDFEYVLYPTVDRPHKNTLTLLKAVERLIRVHQQNIKLIMTSHSVTKDVKDYIKSRHLEREIIFMPKLPISALNYVIANATIVVHPSLAEGGDVFNFSRAISNGTPALISDVEVCREMFERYQIDSVVYKDWMFNPFDHEMLSKKILEIKANKDKFFASQMASLDRLSSYGFKDMAQKYYDAIRTLK
jgi:glycosyltransferase involved in cell wall biosynthesis